MVRTENLSSRHGICLLIVLSLIPCLSLGRAASAAESRDSEYYKMLSTVEYSGQTQFKHQVETLITVKKQLLSDEKTQYSVSSKEFDLVAAEPGSGGQPSPAELSFIIDRKNNTISGAGEDLKFLQKIHNQCAKSLRQVTRQNIGKTWKQSFKLAGLDHSLPDELKLTLTAMEVKTKTFDRMIAVRALSEPFTVKVIRATEGIKNINSRIRAVYLFDPQIKDIYLSITVFDAATNINAPNEKLRYEVATYKTDAAGTAVSLEGLGPDFENFVKKVGLTGKSLAVEKAGPLPQWAQAQGLRTLQAGNLCAALACEGASNPVASVCIPASHTAALQSTGRVASAAQIASISSTLAKSIPGMGGMKIAVAPALAGIGGGTAAAVAGGAVGTVAIAGGFDSDGHGHRSPSTP